MRIGVNIMKIYIDYYEKYNIYIIPINYTLFLR